MCWLDCPNAVPSHGLKSALAIATFTANFFMARPLSAYRLRRQDHARAPPNLSCLPSESYEPAQSTWPVQNEVPVLLICECRTQVFYTIPRGFATSASVSAAFTS